MGGQGLQGGGCLKDRTASSLRRRRPASDELSHATASPPPHTLHTCTPSPRHRRCLQIRAVDEAEGGDTSSDEEEEQEGGEDSWEQKF